MKKALHLLLKGLLALLGVAFGGAVAVGAVYFLNLDNKFMFVLHRILNKITDRVPRDRRF